MELSSGTQVWFFFFGKWMLLKVFWCSNINFDCDCAMQMQSADGCQSHNLGCIDHVWEARKRTRVSYWVCYTEYSRGDIDPYYQMRRIRRSRTHRFVNVRVSIFDVGVLGLAETDGIILHANTQGGGGHPQCAA